MATLVCQPCQNDDLSVEAVGYCVDCAEYLCVTCYKFHCKPQPCRHHVLLDKESMPQQPTQHVQNETCLKHKGKVLEYFCNNHDYIGCSVCMTLEHTTCEGKSYIPDIATSIPDSDEYKELQTSISGLMGSVDDHIEVLKDSLHDTEKIRDSVIADILCFRQKLDEAIDMLENVVRDEVDILTDKAEKERLEQIKHISELKDEIERISSDLNMSIKYRQFLKLFISVKSAKVMTSELKTRLNEFEKFEQIAFEFTPNLSILKLLNALETLGTVNSVRSEMVSVKSVVKSSTVSESVTSIYVPKRSNITESKNTTCKAQNISLKEKLYDEKFSKNKENDDNENIRTVQEAKSENELYLQKEKRTPSPAPTDSKKIEKTYLYNQKSSIVTSRGEESNKSGIGKYILTYSDNEEEGDEKTDSVQNRRHDETVTNGDDTKPSSASVTERNTASAGRSYKTDIVDKNDTHSRSASNLEVGKEERENIPKESLESDTRSVKSSHFSSLDEGKIREEDSEMQSSDKIDDALSSPATPEYGTNIDTPTLSSSEVKTKSSSSPEKQPSVDEIVDDNRTVCHNNATTATDTIITNVEESIAAKDPDSNESSDKADGPQSSQKRPQMNAKSNMKNPKDRVVVFLKDIAVTSVEDSAIPTICGMVALSDDRIAVCDNENKSIKLVDILTNIVVQTIKTDQSPWDVCEAGPEKIAVTFPFAKQIGIYKVTESVKKDYIFNVDGGCYGIAYANENLFVAFGDTNVVKVMDLYGYVLRVLQNMRGEKPIFNTPKHITACPEGRLFYVSNWGNDSITCLTALGHVASIFTDRELKAPRDVAVDSFGLVYVCNFARPCGIQVLTKGLNKVKKLLHKDKSIANPLSLAYSYKGDWLFIGIKGEHLKMYKLTL